MNNRVINIGLCGFGVVGQGVYSNLRNKADSLSSLLGASLEVTRIAVRDLSKSRDFEVDASILTTDPLSIATDPALDVVCELMGGTGLALEVTLAALRSGKIVVSANKALLCDHGPEVLAAAKEGGGHILFEASVAGGIPIIKAINEGLAVNHFAKIQGILNGTCNYILTRMANEGLSYEEILVEAKELGYAEADEALDVDGIDAAHKAVVLAYLAHGRWVPYADLMVQGISEVTQDDIRFARENGYSIKLLAIIGLTSEKKLYISVLPTLISKDFVLGNVDGVFNAVAVEGDVVGDTVYIGPGAGRDATASAVISDLVDAAKLFVYGGPEKRFPFLDPAPRCGADMPLAEPDEIKTRYYMRLQVKDRPGVMAQVAAVFAEQGISLASVSQKEVSEEAAKAQLILTTHLTSEKAILDVVAALSELETVEAKPFSMPISNSKK